jgi:hypothetical protein
MYYDESTDSYVNENFEEMPGTGLMFGVPYLIDRDKYKSVLEKRHFHMRIKDADVVTFSMSSSEIGYVLFAFPKNSPEGSDDFYECFSFYNDDFETQDQRNEEFQKFMDEMADCVVGPSQTHCHDLKNELMRNIRENLEFISIIDEILYKK